MRANTFMNHLPHRVFLFGIFAMLTLGVLFLPTMPVSAASEVITLQGNQDVENNDANDDGQAGHFRQVTTDGGQISIFYTRAAGGGNKDIYVVKTDEDNLVEWEKTFGGSGDDQARHIQQTSDGGYIFTGYTSSQGAGGRDLYVVKLNKFGDKTWETCIGGSSDDEGSFVQQMGGRYIVVGYTKSSGEGDADALAVGLDKNGKKTFQKTYGGKEADYACSAQALNNDSFLMVGATRSFGSGAWNIYVLKCNGSGTVGWERAIGGTENYIGAFVQDTNDNNYLVIGYTYSSSQQRNLCLIQLNTSGKLLWANTVNEQSLYGESMALSLSPETLVDDDTVSGDNEKPAPEVPQQKYSRKSAIQQKQ